MELFRLFGSIVIDDKNAIQALNKTEREAKKSKKAFDDVTGALKNFGIIAGGALTAIGGAGLKKAVDFEKQMSNVGTILEGDVTSRVSELGEEVKKLSSDFGMDTGLLTEGLYNVISALGDSEDSMKTLEIASKNASAGNATVTESVDLLSAVMKGYGDTSSDGAQKASDLAFETLRLGQTSMPELASSMGKVIPLASTMKVSQEELFGAMATLTGVTGGTAEVTTQLRGTLQGFLQPSKQMSEALSNLGYENGQVALESEGLEGILNSLKDEVGGNEIAFANLFGSVEAKNAVLALTGAQAEDFTNKTQAMTEATGATNRAFEIQQDTVGATFDRIKEKGNVLLIDIGEKLLPKLSDLLDWIELNMPMIQEKATAVFEKLSEAIGWVVDNANWLIPVLTTALGIFVSLKVVTAVSHAMVLLKAGMAAVTAAGSLMNAVLALNPFTLIAIAIGVLIGAGVALYMNWDKVKEKAQALWRNLKEVWGKIKEFTSETFNKVKEKISEVFNNIKKTISDKITGVKNKVTEIFTNIKNTISEKVTGAKDKVFEVFDNIKNGISDRITEAKNKVSEIFGNIKDSIGEKINGAKDKVSDAINKIKGLFGFEFKWPKLKMPKFKITGSMNPIKWVKEGVPKLSVNWNAAGAIFDKPTIFSTPYGLQGVGEAGPEAVAPIGKLQSYIAEAVTEAVAEARGNQGMNIVVNVDRMDSTTDVDELMEYMGNRMKEKAYSLGLV